MEDIKEKLNRHFSEYFSEAKTQQLEPLFTDKNEAKRAQEYFEENIEAPYVKAKQSNLGPNPVVFIDVSLDPKKSWNNGIFQNSRHFTMEVEPDPTKNNLEQVTVDRQGLGKKFRKQKGKTLKEIVNKINKYIEGVK